MNEASTSSGTPAYGARIAYVDPAGFTYLAETNKHIERVHATLRGSRYNIEPGASRAIRKSYLPYETISLRYKRAGE
jgi:hypothetical protein